MMKPGACERKPILSQENLFNRARRYVCTLTSKKWEHKVSTFIPRASKVH